MLLIAAVAPDDQTLFLALVRSGFETAAMQVRRRFPVQHPCDAAHTTGCCPIRRTTPTQRSGSNRIAFVLTTGLVWPQIMHGQTAGRRRLLASLAGDPLALQQAGISPSNAAAITAAIANVNGLAGAAASSEALETVSYLTQTKVSLQRHRRL